MNGLSLCSGIAGIELGLRLALGSTYRTVCFVEREAYCVEVLVRRMQEGRLDEAPIWDDLITFPCEQWGGKVDIITAGFPCQPVSCAGQRKAQEDERWLWPHIINIIRQVGPEWVFLENVRGLLSANSGRAFGEVLGGLADAGFDVEWCCVKASDCGAPHRRERIFILAHTQSNIRGALGDGGQVAPDGAGTSHLADPESKRPHRPRGAWPGRTGLEDRSGTVGNSENDGLEGRDGGMEEPNKIPTWPPGPEERDRWAEVLERWPELAPAVANTGGNGRQFIDGISQGSGEHQERISIQNDTDGNGKNDQYTPSKNKPEIESEILRMANGTTNRVDQLRACGNAVVPVVAASAFLTLMERFQRG